MLKRMARKCNSRQYTADEVKELFINQVISVAEYWSGAGKDKRDSSHGCAFSILAMLDGCSMSVPGFVIAPLPHEDDKMYHIKEDEDFYPDNYDSNIQCDIGGSLHDAFSREWKRSNE